MWSAFRIEVLRFCRLSPWLHLMVLAFLGVTWKSESTLRDGFAILVVMISVPNGSTEGGWRSSAPDTYLASRSGRLPYPVLARALWVTLLGLLTCAVLLGLASDTQALFSEAGKLEVTSETLGRLGPLGDFLAAPLRAHVGTTIEVPPHGPQMIALYFGVYLFVGQVMARPGLPMGWMMALYFTFFMVVMFVLKFAGEAHGWLLATYGLQAAAVLIAAGAAVTAWNVRVWQRASW